MTGMIDDAFQVSDGADPYRADDALHQVTEAAALLEQAKGVLIFRYSIGAGTAYGQIRRWAEEADVGIETVAHALVHDICQGDADEPSDPRFVRWLEDRLRREFPRDPNVAPRGPLPVTVAVDQSDSSLDAVVESARAAVRTGVPLAITVDPASLQGVTRPQSLQRIELAGELARAVAPGLEVLVPTDCRLRKCD